MTDIQKLLDQIGQPPKDVCLDWAWQLRALHSPTEDAARNASIDRHGDCDSDNSTASITTSVSDTQTNSLTKRESPKDDASNAIEAKQLQWSDFNVDSAGQLTLCDRDFATRDQVAVSHLLNELLDWAEDSDERTTSDAAAHSSDAAIERRLQTLTLSHDSGSKTQTGSVTAPEASSKKTPVSRTSSAKTKSDFSAEGVRNDNKPVSLRPANWMSFVRSRVGMAILGVLLLCGVVGLRLWMASPFSDATADSVALAENQDDRENGETYEASGISEDDRESEPQTDEPELLANSRDRSPDGEIGFDAELGDAFDSDILDSLAVSPGTSNSSPGSSNSDGLLDTASRNDVEESADLSGVDVTNVDQASAEGTPEDAGAIPSSDEATMQAADDVDVLETLRTVAKQAQAAESESELDVEADASTTFPPLIVATFPPVQTQRLPPGVRIKARKPGWRLRIGEVEGFVIEPLDAQVVVDRNVAIWRLREQDFEADSPQVLVQAELVSGRGTKLRWRIAVGAEDMPQVYIPLGRSYLDQLQLNLAYVKTRLQAAIDMLKRMGRADGLPSGAKSAMVQRRRGFESELKLVGRVLEVVSAANQLEGWLDGQIEVHAQLIDTSTEGSPVLLQFGDDLTAPADEDAKEAEDKPAEDAVDN